MKRFAVIWIALYFFTFFISCKKESPSGTVNPPPPPPPEQKVLRIYNLEYSPNIVPIKLYSPTFSVNGSLYFENAKNGIAKLRLKIPEVTDTTIMVQGPAIQRESEDERWVF